MILLIGVAIAYWMMAGSKEKSYTDEAAQKNKEAAKGPVIKTIKAGMTATDKGLTIIGETHPYQTVTLYAKTSGYLEKIFIDKGQKVTQGKLLAVINSPEVEQQYKAAIADLENKKKILARDKKLLEKEYISKEDVETSETTVKVAEALVHSLKEQMSYRNITAPFSGTITARYADPGALVQNATNAQTGAQPIATLSQLDKIRIYAFVAQADATHLSEGNPVLITSQDLPDFKMEAKVTRIAGELDPKTRMMLVEIDIDNKENKITPGAFVNVTFKTPESKNLAIPSEAVVIKGKQFFVGLVKQDSTIHLQPITIENNNGVRATILNGLNKGDLIGVSLNLEIVDGQKVRIQ